MRKILYALMGVFAFISVCGFSGCSNKDAKPTSQATSTNTQPTVNVADVVTQQQKALATFCELYIDALNTSTSYLKKGYLTHEQGQIGLTVMGVVGPPCKDKGMATAINDPVQGALLLAKLELESKPLMDLVASVATKIIPNTGVAGGTSGASIPK